MKRLVLLLLIAATHATSRSQTSSEDSLYNRAVSLLNASEKESAVSVLTQLLNQYPKSAKSYNLYGAILLGQGDTREALDMFRTSVQADSTFWMGYMNLGNTYTDLGELDSAIAVHSFLVSRHSANGDYYNDLGDAYMKKKEVRQAEACFLKAVQLNPHYVLAHRNLGAAYAAQEKYKEAVDELYIARTLDGHFPGLQDELYHVTQSAESAFEEWVERAPRNADAHYYYSFFLYYDEDREEAVGALDRAIALDEKEEKYYLLRALWLWNLEKYDRAMSDCRKCLELNPGSWQAHKLLASCYESVQDVPKAIEHLRTAIRIDSLVVGTRFRLGEDYGITEEYQKAIDELQAALRLGHKSPLANYDMAICYNKLGNYDQALYNLRLARSRNAKYPRKGLSADLDKLQKQIEAKMR